MTNTKGPSGLIEVWLRQASIGIGCTVVKADESTYEKEVDSLSMRGAEREVTGFFIRQGYKPLGRWDTTASDRRDETVEVEVMRVFKPAS